MYDVCCIGKDCSRVIRYLVLITRSFVVLYDTEPPRYLQNDYYRYKEQVV